MATPVDFERMAHALRLAARGLYTTTPNPRVGCVLVRDGTVVGEGWHERAGGPHAEVVALRAAGERARGATAYVTLEPCSHHGRTPPCADALVAAGVVRVVAAMQDPNPLVAGDGYARLRAAGVEVESGVLEREAAELNVGFVARMTRGTPWVRLKVAATLDGRTALENGVSKWITSPEARRDGHGWRARACAVLTGIGTVLDDDPRLDVREVATTRQPLRVIVDSRLEIPPAARVLAGGGALVACAQADDARAGALRDLGCELLALPNADGKVDLPALLRELARRGMNELHVEAGCKLNGSLVREGLVDELLVYLAPKLVGDRALGMFRLPALTALEGAVALDIFDLARIGPDVRLRARVERGDEG